MKVSKALEDVWQWKEEVYQDIKGMTVQERMAYYRQAEKRLEERTGIKLQLTRVRRAGAKTTPARENS